MNRYICIHGHFYQPPRENPWLEDIELQDAAYPYHDWNKRITAECYEPNTASRILDNYGWIKKIVNNYVKISFNFGPTLLSWMETNEPDVYQKIIEADQESQQNFSGHGSALAQAYNHIIMPLANRRDKYTQIIWGIKDFVRHFGRLPEGMWLPETAVDLETLSIMAEQGILFIILAPSQARRVRKISAGNWQEVGPKGIDTFLPYRVYLPNSERTINAFFYNSEVSCAVAFEKLLDDGERFAKRLLGGFREECSAPQLVSIATDGETYGHHHRHGDMALAYALDYIESNKLAQITNYGEYLEQHPPTYEVEVKEGTSWSCVHGVERWRSNCGCNSELHPGWSQAWRAPLRNALNWLRNKLVPHYEERAGQYLKDPWAARDDYLAVIYDRSPGNLHHFLEKHANHELNLEEQITVLKLLEMQRYTMFMFTSCGWFFDEISGIETVQVLQYAGRVIQLAKELFNNELEYHFLEILAQAKSNIAEYKDGARIYEKFVKPAMVNLLKVGAHYAICSLFEAYDEQSSIYCYIVQREDIQNRLAGETKLTVGRAHVNSEITHESINFIYSGFNLSNQIVNAGVRIYQNEESYREIMHEVTSAFDRADFYEVIRLLDKHFEGEIYSLKQLFRDKQRVVLNQILETTLAEIAADYQQIYEHHAPLMRFLRDLNIPQPKVLYTAAEFVLNTSLCQAFAQETLDLEHIEALLNEVEALKVPLDSAGLAYVLKQTLEEMGGQLYSQPADSYLVAHLDAVVGLVRSLPFEVDLWKVQNIYYELLRTVYPDFRKKAGQADKSSQIWVEHFEVLGDKLRMRRGK